MVSGYCDSIGGDCIDPLKGKCSHTAFKIIFVFLQNFHQYLSWCLTKKTKQLPCIYQVICYLSFINYHVNKTSRSIDKVTSGGQFPLHQLYRWSLDLLQSTETIANSGNRGLLLITVTISLYLF